MRNRILVVDDEQAILFAMKSYFGRRGFVVDGASGLDQAHELICRERYDLAFIDVRLSVGDADGLSIAPALRQRFDRIPIIVMSACDTIEIRDRARQAGADSFVEKPLPLRELARIASALLHP